MSQKFFRIQLVTSLLAVIFWTVALQAQPSSRENPLPLVTQELKGNIAPNVMMERFYSFTGGPGEVSFSLEVKSYEQWSNIVVELFDADSQTLIKFDASSGGDRKDAKLRLENRQPIVMRVYGPRNNQSGNFTLKVKGAISLNRSTAQNNRSEERRVGKECVP